MPESPATIPSPTLVAAWGTLGTLATERVPYWAAYWLVAGHDGENLAGLAGLHGDDPGEIRGLLPAALAECGVAVPSTDAAAAMVAFTGLAQLYVDGRAGARWVVGKVGEVLARCRDADAATALPLGQLDVLDDQWGAGWGRGDQQLLLAVGQACVDQLSLATMA